MHFGGPRRIYRRSEGELEFRYSRKALVSFKRLLAYLGGHWLKVAGLLVLTGVIAALGLVSPYLWRVLLDKVILGSRRDLLPWVVGAYVGVTVTSSIVGYAHDYFGLQVGHSIIRRMRNQLYEHLQSLGLHFFETRQTGAILSRIVSDTEAVQNAAFHSAEVLVSSALTLVGVVGMLVWMSPVLACYVLIPVPVFAASTVFYSKTLKPLFIQFRERVADLNAFVQERVSGVRVVKSFAREEQEQRAFEQKTDGYYRAFMKAALVHASIGPWMGLVFSAGGLIVMLIGGRMATLGVLTPGTLMAFAMYLMQFYRPIGSIGRLVGQDIPNALAAAERVFEFMDEQDRLPVPEDALRPEKLRGEVEFRHATFSYGEGDVLKDINLKIAPTETVALVGPSGVGKTTLVDLVLRFYDVQGGQVLIDGVDARRYDPRALRGHIGLVLQEPFLFDTTVRENIAYGRPDATEEEIRAAAAEAEADEFIEELPRGYDTGVGERGVRLSVGQKQRISIARALLKDPAILILDEATSAVDTLTEKAIQRALETAARGRTTILIAHRLSTTFFADRIVVLDKGRILEEGPAQELLAAGGLFAQLYNMQVLESLAES
jgi:ABC-type multidrug transport system fused ATPase/permease subunit